MGNPAAPTIASKNTPRIRRRSTQPTQGQMVSQAERNRKLIQDAEERAAAQSQATKASDSRLNQILSGRAGQIAQQAVRKSLAGITGGASEVLLKAYKYKKQIAVVTIIWFSIIIFLFFFVANAVITLWENKTQLAEVLVESAQNGSCRELAADKATFGVLNVAEDNDFNRCVNYIFTETEFLGNGGRLDPAD